LSKVLPPFKFEILSTKHETNSKSEFSNAQNKVDQICQYCFGHLDFENLKIVSDFDIRISDLHQTPKNKGIAIANVGDRLALNPSLGNYTLSNMNLCVS
jgi:hypothetical protein